MTPATPSLVTANLDTLARRVVNGLEYLDGLTPDELRAHRDDRNDVTASVVTTLGIWSELFPGLSGPDAAALAREYADGRRAVFQEVPE